MPQDTKPAIDVKVGNNVLDIRQGDQPFLVYNFNNDQAGLYKPFFHPILGSNGWPITQNGEFPGTIRGHCWHHGLFLGHQKISHKTDAGSKTSNFWEEKVGDSGGIVHIGFTKQEGGPVGGFQEQLVWRSSEGRDVLQETRTVVVGPGPQSRRAIDLLLQFRGASGPVRLEQTPYNLLACRVINALCPEAQKKQYTKEYGNLVDFHPLTRFGELVNSEGKKNEEVRGEKAKWLDFSGPLDNGSVGGIAILDHPTNPRHPTPWNNWNNMTFMASFTFQEFFELPAAAELRLRYRVLIHAGDAKQADVEGAWNDFAHQM